MKESNVSNITKRVEYYLPCKSLWLLDLKKYTCLELHKTYGEISIKQPLFNYLANLDNYIFAKFVSLFIIFAGRDDIVHDLSETDMAEMIGTSRSTIQKYVSKCSNLVFNVLASDHYATVQNHIAGNGDHIACNSYQLLDEIFSDFAVAKSENRIGASQKFKFKFKNLKIGNYFLTIYNKKTLENLNKKINTLSTQPSIPSIPSITLEKVEQNIDNQVNIQTNFKHFDNPIYSPGFDADGTPKNWETDLCGWAVWAADEKTTLTIEGIIKKAGEVWKSGSAQETWVNAANALADISVLGNTYKVATNASGKFSIQIKVKEQPDDLTITVAPDDITENAFQHWTDQLDNGSKKAVGGTFKRVTSPSSVNTKLITKTGSTTKYEFKPSAKMYFKPTDGSLTGWGSYDWSGKYDDEE